MRVQPVRPAGTSTLLVLALISAASCTGQIEPGVAGSSGAPGSTGAPGSPGNPSTTPSASACRSSAVGRTVLRRLNQREYTNTLEHLLGVTGVGVGVPPDVLGGAALDTNAAELRLSNQDMDGLHDVAAAAVEGALGAAPARFLTCTPGAAVDRAACTGQILRPFLTRAFRRPATDDELARYGALVATPTDFKEGIALAMRAALMSPSFLFQVIDDSASVASGTHRLGDYELASRLSYALWSSMPDDRLMDLAARRELGKPAVAAAEVARMLADPRASKGILRALPEMWLGYDAVDTADKMGFPAFANLRASLKEETDRLFENVVRQDRPIDELLTASYSFLNADLAAHYGAKAPAVPRGEFARVEMDTRQRRGILTQASFLASHASQVNDTFKTPIARGVTVARVIACQAPPPPSGDAAMKAMSFTADGNLTTRQNVERIKTAGAVCRACHEQFEAFGLALETYDTTGKWRTTDGQGRPIDATGMLPGTGQPFASAPEMATLLAGDTRFETCLAKYVASFALGRLVQPGTDEGCYLQEIVSRGSAGKSLGAAELLGNILTSDLSLTAQTGGR